MIDTPSISWFWFLLGGLATFRLSLMISRESGPGWIFRKLRRAPPAKSSLSAGLSCVHCTSVWWAAPVSLFFLWRMDLDPSDIWLVWLALSAMAIILHHAFTEDMPKS